MNENSNRKDEIRTIITKAIAGRTIQPCQGTMYINTRSYIEPTQALGCSIKNTKIKACRFDGMKDNLMYVLVDGEFDIHVWVGITEDTKVSKRNIKFSDIIPVESLGGTNSCEDGFANKTIIPWINKEPVSLGMMVVNRSGVSEISVQVEYEIGVEVIEETKMDVLCIIRQDEEDEEPLFDPNVEEQNDYDDVD
jgi:hypothetical protein